MRTSVYAFVDGLNLYNGLVSKGLRRHLWLDIRSLLQQFCLANQHLCDVSYFTARVSGPPERVSRQTSFLDAVESTGVNIVYGRAERRSTKCPNCKKNWMRTAEKMSDVALASHLLLKAQRDPAGEFWVVSGDSDLVPAVRMAREEYGARVLIVAPPGRNSDELNGAAAGVLHVRRSWLGRAQFPQTVDLGPGLRVTRPASWPQQPSGER